MKLKSRKPKFAVVALGDNVDVGSFFNLLMSNGYPNVTFLTNIIDHVEVKKYISEIQELEKSSSAAEATESILDKRSTSPEPLSMPSVTATVNVIPSTSVFIPPLETEIRSTSNMKLNPDASYINCKLCDNKIMVSRLSNLTNHVRRHSSVKQYSCIYCPYQHNEMSKVRTHMASQHGDSLTTPNDNLTPELQKIWCAYMEKCFPGYLDSQGKSGRSALEVFGGRTLAKLDGAPSSSTMEEEEAVNLADKLHNCCECGDAISGEDDSKEPFTNHIREKHADVCSPYKCGECGFLAAYEYIVRGHIVSEHAMIAADVAVTIQPDYDGVPDISEELKAFVDTAQSQVEENNYANEENAHFSEAVSAEMLLGCDSNTENEDISMEREQTTCTICSLSFNLDDIESLMYHAKKHYFIKQFECPECEFAAEEYDEVENHLGACHAGEGAVVDLNGEMLQQAWMQTMKKCFSELVDRNEIHTTGNDKDTTLLGYNKQEFAEVMKVLQRFHKNPNEWPEEDKPFAMVDRNFFKKVMHVSEFTPHRGFAVFVPFGMMLLRHAFRRFSSKQGEKNYGSEDFLNEKNIMAGTKQAFEVIAQNAYNNTMNDLVERGVCTEEAVQRFTAASSQMSDRQRNLFNLTKKDIFAIAPGPYKHFQMLRPYQFKGEFYVLYSLLCCAFYKKQILYDAVRDVPLLDKSEDAEALPIPAEYGYDAPRSIYGYLTFGNAIDRSDFKKIDPESYPVHFSYHLYDIFHGICLYSSNSNKLSDILLLSRLWKRTPLFIGNNSSEHEQPWSISRGSRLTHLDIRDRMCCVHDVKRIVLLPERHDGMFVKLFHSIMWYFTARKIKRLLKYFPCEENEALEHILEGNKHLFKLILDSILKKDFGRLENGTLGKNTLDFHRDAASKLTEAQRNSIKIAADDLIGENGFFKNWGAFLTTSELITGYLHSPEFNITKDATGQPLDKPVVKYSVQLLALLKKKELFKKVCHDLKSTVPITMPSNYGYRVPRYIIMEIEICHEMDENPSDALLFDFHIISFANVYDSGAMEKRIKNNIR